MSRSSMRKIFFLFCLLCIAGFHSLAAGPKISYYILEDKERTLPATQALDLFQEGKYTLQADHQFNPGFTRSVYWLAVKADSAALTDSLVLVIGQTVINKIEFYAVARGQVQLQLKTGDHYPYKQRPLQTPEFCFPLSKHCDLYLLRIDKHNESLQLTFDTLDPGAFISFQSTNSFITGGLTGVIILLLIFGLYLSFITRRKIYIFYLLYITSGWFWVLSDLGYGFKYIWPESIWFASRSRPLFCDLTIALSLQYLIYYLGNIRSSMLKKLLRITSYAAFFFVGLWLLPIDVHEASQLAWVMLLSIPLLVVIYVILSFITLFSEARNKNIMALFYLGALIPLMTLTLVNILNHSGFINISGSILEHYGVPIGYVCEAIILTFGLAFRFNSYRLEKERLQLAIERHQTENAKALIDTEAKERQRIADELHDISGSMISAARLNIHSVLEKNFTADHDARLKLEKAEEALASVAVTVRNLSHALSPVMLQKLGFKKSVENIITFFNTSGKLRIEVLVVGFETYEPRNERLYTVLYSIIYELLNNTVKHSGASDAVIQLVEHEDSVTLIVEDNGKGMLKAFENTGTKGLSGIVSKINYFDGAIEFDNTDHGLVISIEIPIRHYEKTGDAG
jgi:two-component system, sensor histidine kinase LadS